MLIDDRLPPPPARPDQPVWEPDWRVWAWVLASAGAAIGCFLTTGLASFVLLCAAVGCGAHAITQALPYGSGLRDYRQ